MLQGSFTFKGITLRTAYLDLSKITLENGTAVAEYKVYADKAAFEADKTQYLTTHSESFPYTTKQIQTCWIMVKLKLKKQVKGLTALLNLKVIIYAYYR